MGGYWFVLVLIVLFTVWPLAFGLSQVAAVSVPMGTLALVLWAAVLLIARTAHARRSAGVATPGPQRVNFLYYAVSLVVILGVGYATLGGWLPSTGLLLVAFMAIFWLFSFVFALVTTFRKPKAK
jgi:hypothetical protein